jgi:DNA-binding transcriptional regulator YiaG
MTDRDVSKLLTDWRAQARLSQSQAAEMLDVPLKTLQGWEQGRETRYAKLIRNSVRLEMMLSADNMV